MKKAIYFIVFTIIIIILLTNSFEIMNSIKFSFDICINNLFPSLIPFMLLSNILIEYNFFYEINIPILSKIFKINNNSTFIFIMSILSGTPSNAKYIKEMLDKNLIDINDAKKCLNFCHFTNPLFILGTVGLTFFNSKQIGLIILISHYTAAIIIGIFNNKNYNNVTYIYKKDKKKFINILLTSIKDTTDTLLLILGIVTVTLIFTSIINSYLNINSNFKFIYGIFEITQGLKYLSFSNLNINIKAIIACFIISFGGICIHMQVFSIINNKKIRYLPYLKSRILQSIISCLICYLLISLFN